MEDWMEVKENNQDVRSSTSSFSINNFDHEKDVMVKLFGEKSSLEKVMGITKIRVKLIKEGIKIKVGIKFPLKV